MHPFLGVMGRRRRRKRRRRRRRRVQLQRVSLSLDGGGGRQQSLAQWGAALIAPRERERGVGWGESRGEKKTSAEQNKVRAARHDSGKQQKLPRLKGWGRPRGTTWTT